MVVFEEENVVWGRRARLDNDDRSFVATKECGGCKEYGERDGDISSSKRRKGRPKGRKNFENRSKPTDGGRVLRSNSRMVEGVVKSQMEDRNDVASDTIQEEAEVVWSVKERLGID
ncbi:Uncharacterized protein TCM_007924 [Theobroma cacao]|uniref:Uncharacterized protein n=1 Tax=Theobroma cacao TaxID=3641 RepID=A0A061EAK0_THECC|nr:Uncharacterized protein TCM_007924 [Theobroma cacao]